MKIGAGVRVCLRESGVVPEAVAECVRRLIHDAAQMPGVLVDYGTLSINCRTDPVFTSGLIIEATVDTKQRPYTQEELKAAVVDMCKAAERKENEG